MSQRKKLAVQPEISEFPEKLAGKPRNPKTKKTTAKAASHQPSSSATKYASFQYSDKLPDESLMLEELLKTTEIQQLFESFYNLINIPIAIIDLNANVLLSSRRPRICTQFHRAHPTTCSLCIESDAQLAMQLKEGKNYAIYPCRNGLTECASPIIIEGKHVANVFIGQFLTNEPDEDVFRRQAEELGFDTADYLAALHEVPIVDEEKIPVIFDLLIRMTRVISNLSIERKIAVENQIRNSIILNTIPQSVFWKDVDGRYIGCNAAFAKAAGLAEPDDIVGKTDFDLPWPQQDTEAYRADDQAVISSSKPRLHIIEPLQQADGSRLVIDTSKIPLVDTAKNVRGMVGVYEDITERAQMEEALRQSEEKFRRSFMTSLDAVYLATVEEGRLIEANPVFEEIFGYTQDEAIGKTPSELGLYYDPSDRARMVSELKGKGFVKDLEMKGRKKGGGVITVSISMSKVLMGDQLHILGVIRDITDRKQDQTRILKLSRLYDTLSKVNTTIVHSTNQEELFRSICKGVVEHKKFIMAWVGLVDETTHRVNPVCHAGTEQGYLTNIFISVDDIPEGDGPTGTSIRENRVCFINNFLKDERVRPWYKSALKCGFKSSVGLPLRLKGKVIGALTIYSVEPDFFDAEQLALMNEMSTEISFALDKLASETERKQAERKVLESEKRFRAIMEQSPIAIALLDMNGQPVVSNAALSRMVGYSSGELSHMTFAEFTYPEDAEKDQSQFSALLEGKISEYSMEKRYVHKNGSIVWGNLFVTLRRDRNGLAEEIIGMAEDITERKRAEEELQNREMRYRSVLESISLIGVMVDKESNITLCNDFMLNLTGWKRKEVLNCNYFDVFVPRDVVDSIQRDVSMKAIAAGTIPAHYENEIVTCKGERRMVSWNNTVLRDPGGSILGLSAIGEDITERKQTEEYVAHYLKELETAMQGTLLAVSNMVEMRDPYTAGHERRVGVIAADIAREMGWPDEKCNNLQSIGLVHDIGKIAIPAELLSKPTRLSALEYEIIKTHSERGYEILKEVKFRLPVAEIIYQHHERNDGSGYPRGLKGDEILPEARILSVADVLEAMASHRPYRPSLGIEKALTELERGQGTIYDTNAVNACLRLFREKGYTIPA
jgi:PAS domain S-box-containing protein/putative nucleotidyltransferase with HDIG domain